EAPGGCPGGAAEAGLQQDRRAMPLPSRRGIGTGPHVQGEKMRETAAMLDQVPAWLGKVLPNARAGHGKLAITRLANAVDLGRGGFALRSAAFADGEALDPSFTADEDDAVAPPLEWSAPPAGTQELALVVE